MEKNKNILTKNKKLIFVTITISFLLYGLAFAVGFFTNKENGMLASTKASLKPTILITTAATTTTTALSINTSSSWRTNSGFWNLNENGTFMNKCNSKCRDGTFLNCMDGYCMCDIETR